MRDLFIGGRLVPASDGGRFDVIDPATGDVFETVANGTVEDAISAVDAAAQAAPASCCERRPSAWRAARSRVLLPGSVAIAAYLRVCVVAPKPDSRTSAP